MSIVEDRVGEQASDNMEENADNIEQVREILFGDVRRTHNERLDSLESKLQQIEEKLTAQIKDVEAQVIALSKSTDESKRDMLAGLSEAISGLAKDVKTMSKT